MRVRVTRGVMPVEAKLLLAALMASSMFTTSAAIAAPEGGQNADEAGDGKPRTTADDAAAYCDYVKGGAHSESAVLVTPRLFGTYGYLDGQGALYSAQPNAIQLTPHILGGAMYSVADLYRGVSINGRATAECERYKALSNLHAFLESNRDAMSLAALKAKAQVLDGALAKAEGILKTTFIAMQASRGTLDELNATQLRVDALRALSEQTHQDMESLAVAPQAPPGRIADVVHARNEAEENVERFEARVRESRGWDLTLRGGYDRLVNVKDYFFASATVSVSLGWLFQFGPDSTAIEGRRAWASRQTEGVDDRVAQLTVRLRAMLKAEKVRLAETTTLLNDLEARLRAIESIPGDKAHGYADILWFDMIKVKADHDYLFAHVRDLETTLGEDAKAPPG